MVDVYTDERSDTTFIIPTSEAENDEILKNPIPSDIWVNIESSKRLPIYVRRNTAKGGPESDSASPTELPRDIVAASAFLLQQLNPKKQIKQVVWCQLSTTASFAKLPRNTAKVGRMTISDGQSILATKQANLKVDFEAEQAAYLAQKTQQNSQRYMQSKKSELEASRAYKEIAEQNRKGYSDLFDQESMQMSSNQNRGDDWEDDFM